MQGGGEQSEGGAPEVLRKSRKRRPSLGHLQQLAEARLAKERKHLQQHTVLDCDDNFLSPEAAHVRQTEVEPEADVSEGQGHRRESWEDRLRDSRTSWREKCLSPPQRAFSHGDECPQAPPIAGNRICSMDSFVTTVLAHILALDHPYNTQVCEAVNGLHASMHPKRHDMSRTTLGRAVHMLCTARYNDGLLVSTRDVLKQCGLEIGHVGHIILTKQDRARSKMSNWRRSIHGKRKRKENKKRRLQRDLAVQGDDRAYEAGVLLASDDEETGLASDVEHL